ncbi:DUF6193 family natural product biosynthesis protein [Kitasatospora sp. NBC_01539]|uniref:DUF6193 family natural product biosynthesis protein n=1 Tax=Kitasatospora sp. NBC_01539 TaxID=2903577 RepID=UPI003860129D
MASSPSDTAPDSSAMPRSGDGDFPADLLRAAAELGLGLPVPEERWERKAEFSGGDGRRAVVLALREEPGYWVRCYEQRACLATGTTSDPAAVVAAVAAWTGGAGLERARESAPFIGFGDWALEHEREPFGAVELAWWHRLDRGRAAPWVHNPRAQALLEAAHAQPELRRLMPVTSHFMLWFSTRINYPYIRVGYSVDPLHDGQYLVRDRGEIIAHTATPEEAVALVVAALPKDTGPAS